MTKELLGTYSLPVWSEKAGENHSFQVTLLQDGWKIINPPLVGGICDTYGNYILEEQGDKINPEGLKECFAQDYIIYPSSIGTFLHSLHYRINDGQYKDFEEVQRKFNELGDWIIKLNKEAPTDIEI